MASAKLRSALLGFHTIGGVVKFGDETGEDSLVSKRVVDTLERELEFTLST